MDPTHEHPAALAAEELRTHLGLELGVSRWITVDQARIDAFAACTEDRQWIHVDVERDHRESPFGGPIAHGYLTLSLLAPTSMEVLEGRIRARQLVNYGMEKMRLVAPVHAGRQIRNRIRLLQVEDKGPARHLLSLECTMEIAGSEKPALSAVMLVMAMA